MNNELILTKKEFKKIMEVIKYTSKEEYRPILKAVHFEGDEVVALDGYRIAIRTLNTKLDVNCNIDAKNLKEVIKLVTKEVKNIKMEFNNHTFIIELLGENDKLIDVKYYAYVEGDYINYKSIIDVDTFKFNTKNIYHKAGTLGFKDVAIDGSTNTNFLVSNTAASANSEKLIIDGCKVTTAKPVYYNSIETFNCTNLYVVDTDVQLTAGCNVFDFAKCIPS